MSPRSPVRTATRPQLRPLAAGRLALLVLAALLVFVAAGCGASFDPTGPCAADGSAPGAYPTLEAAIPATYNGAKPSQLDSGRACTSAGLGSLAAHGVKELRFAGGIWSTGTQSGLSLALFLDQDGPTLDPTWMTEFYSATAVQGKNVQSIDTVAYPVSGSTNGQRIDVLNGDSFQSIVVWQRDGWVAVALVADFVSEIQTKEAHDAVVRAAVDAFAG
jgi:hypothetical protein